jgi:C4-dicarboxylate transporter DctQ subunit
MRFIKHAFDWVFLALTWFALFLLGVMTALIFADVFCRYVLHFSIAWADEICLIFLVWYVFIALAIGVRRKVHSSIDLLTICFKSKRLDRYAKLFVDFLTFVFGALLVDFGLALIQIGSFSTLASVDLPSYWEYVFIPVSGVLVMYTAAIDFFRDQSADPKADLLDTVFMTTKADRNV